MEKEVAKVEPNKGLMKKKKVELVEIILRKDELERNLRSQINNTVKDLEGTERQIESFKSKFEKLNKEYNELKNSAEDLCDKYVTDCQTYKNKIKKYNIIVVILCLILMFKFFWSVLF